MQEAAMAALARLVLYGDSVFLAGLKAGLSGETMLELIKVEADRPDAADCIRALNPCAVIFDMSAAQPDLAIPLLRLQPSLLLIGVDACSDELLVLWPHKQRAVSIADLVEVIRRESDTQVA
jgi:hypothetical protein